MKMESMYEQLGVSAAVYEYGERIIAELRDRFDAIDQTAEYNQAKVLSAMQKNRVNATHFAATTGYGYDDEGRDNLERVYADVFHTEAALVAVLTLLFVGGEDYSPLALLAIALVCTGAIGLGVVDATEDPELRLERQKASNYKYAKSFLALALPAAYCLLDAAGTFADNRVLEILTDRYMNAGMFATLRECADQAAASANCAYELTFLAAAAFCFIYVVVIKKDRLVPKMEAPKYFGAICETAGQFAYIYAISDTAHLAMSAPIISSYCAASVLWSRIFLKEKLSRKHYAMICLVVIGIAIMGFFDL